MRTAKSSSEEKRNLLQNSNEKERKFYGKLDLEFENKEPNNINNNNNNNQNVENSLSFSLKTASSGTDVSAEVEDMKYIRTTLRNYPWYHGTAFTDYIQKYLKWEHSFLLRRSINQYGKTVFCLSIRESEKIINYEVHRENSLWSCPKLFEKLKVKSPEKKMSFNHIAQLLDYWSLYSHISIPIPRPSSIIFNEDVEMVKSVGKGAFGEVWQGVYTDTSGQRRDCAVKLIKGTANKSQIQEFMKEAKIMELFDSEYVTRLYGIGSLTTPVMLVMEFLPGQNIRSFLRKGPNSPKELLYDFVSDIAQGMKHLNSKNVIHRDLAARNCLLSWNMTIKISDFGLSVQAAEIKVKRLKQAPIRWLSPETLSRGIFNEKTDVWSYGVVVWEVFTRCERYPLYPNNIKTASKLIQETDNPHKLPDSHPQEIRDLVEECCRKIPTQRPRFRQITVNIQKVTKRLKAEKNATSGKDKVELRRSKSGEKKVKQGSEKNLFSTLKVRKSTRNVKKKI